MDRLAKLFVLNRAGLNLKRGAVVFGGMLVPFVVLTALDQQQYFLPAAFATLFAAMCDPGGEYRTRVQMMAGMAVAGALLTGLGFAVGARGWGLVVLAAFVVTLAAGLMVKFGGHRFFAAVLLNVWFIEVRTQGAALSDWRLPHKAAVRSAGCCQKRHRPQLKVMSPENTRINPVVTRARRHSTTGIRRHHRHGGL